MKTHHLYHILEKNWISIRGKFFTDIVWDKLADEGESNYYSTLNKYHHGFEVELP